ncbi:0b8e859e-3b32-48d2-aaf5-4ed0451cd56a [Sclerotinia trifoliorum]|uniref:non-specific serine/threonine protein kinase n=1 Tax=Sclerotinia trifoliorum TaxID=28548 RepID=A0A8H2W0T0_9HELO|nr:0b8e859e-3b32-48d2-aaf5-4ed0451cd56a [Sclerotinia trifoliorum]
MTRKYGKKRPAVSAAAVAIFGSATQPIASKIGDPISTRTSQSPSVDLESITNVLENTNLGASVDDVTILLERTNLESGVELIKTPVDVYENTNQNPSPDDVANLLERTTLGSAGGETTFVEEHLVPTEAEVEVQVPQTSLPIAPALPPLNPRLAASLSPLLDAYEKDNGYSLATKNWDDVLAPGCSIQKIAEASYAEVFRISNPVGSSILKLLRLKVPTDPTSKRSDTAIKVETVVSEMRLMNALTEIPGFVKFKDAHIVEGKPPAAFVTAYEGHLNAGGESYFPHPNKISKHAVFLAIELGDAGHVLEKYSIKNADQLWDIFLGVVIALARAEIEHEFEHRDLHENNICILEHTPPAITSKSKLRSKSKSQTPTSPHKFGNSGLEITILDYGLSRATIYPHPSPSNPSPPPETVFYNLESDTAVFSSFEPSSIAGIQFDTYRRMRAYLFSGGHSNTNDNTPNKAIRDALKKKTHSWEEYMPYTNVLWLYFLIEYLTEVAPKGGRGKQGKQAWIRETEELRWLLHPDWVPGNGQDGIAMEEQEEELGLGSAGDVLQYAFDMGWIHEEDLEDLDTSRLSLREDS